MAFSKVSILDGILRGKFAKKDDKSSCFGIFMGVNALMGDTHALIESLGRCERSDWS